MERRTQLSPPKKKTGTKVSTRRSVGGQDLEFRKSNASIGLRVSEGRLSLLARKIFNVMVYTAQQEKEPGRNAPTKDDIHKRYFWMPFGDVVRHASYDSHDTKILKDHLQELQNIKVVLEDDREWTSERLVGSVKLVGTKGLHNRFGEVWFGFEFPPEVQAKVMNPVTYTPLSLYYQTMLRSGASLSLYELCRRYATNPSKVTHSEEWEWWYGALTGNPIGDEIPLYKYFKRDTLKPAISEINANTDIEIELIEHKRGRRVLALQFSIKLRAQSPLKFGPSPVINGELIKRLMGLGLTQEDAANLSVLHSEEKLLAAEAAVSARRQARNSKTLDSPAGYFKWALKHGIGASPNSPSSQEPTKIAGPTLREQYRSAQAVDALRYFAELDESVRDEHLAEFRKTREGKAVFAGTKGLDSPLMQAALGGWIANKLWGAPSDAELVAFADTLGGAPSG